MFKKILIFISQSLITYYIGVIGFKIYYHYNSLLFLVVWVVVAPFISYLLWVAYKTYIEDEDIDDLSLNIVHSLLSHKVLNINDFLNVLMWPLFKYIFYVFIVPLIGFYLHFYSLVNIFNILKLMNKIIIIYLYIMMVYKDDDDQKFK